jgi:putative NADPH-quinone reductase
MNTYNTLTPATLKGFVDAIFVRDPTRTFVMPTGERGMTDHHLAIRRELCRLYLKDLFKERKITEDQHRNLLQMVRSSDIENLTVAEAIAESLSTKNNSNVSNI